MLPCRRLSHTGLFCHPEGNTELLVTGCEPGLHVSTSSTRSLLAVALLYMRPTVLRIAYALHQQYLEHLRGIEPTIAGMKTPRPNL